MEARARRLVALAARVSFDGQLRHPVFFAVTGLTLNHTEWFAGAQRTVQSQGAVGKSWLGAQVAKLEVVEHLRHSHGIRGALSDFRMDDSQCAVSFKGPGYTADAFIDRARGRRGPGSSTSRRC